MTDHDRQEQKFSRYLRELAEWDRAQMPLPFAPHTHGQANERIRERIQAEVAIYERVYGEKP